MKKRIRLRSAMAAALLLSFSMTLPMPAKAAEFGTYQQPFAANSLWNSRPVEPTFAGDVIPTSSYYPSISTGAYSTGIFLAAANDGPVTVKGPSGKKGLLNADDETYHDVTIPRWPASAAPASGSDGHADIVDPVTGIIHSFWQLKKEGTQWVATQYAWTRLDGSGWPEPGHYYQGARATGVPAAGGLMRIHEVADRSAPYYPHALCLSLTTNGLSANPTYVFPATTADWNAATVNTGAFPEGSLLMLPPSFDTAQITDADLRKVAETLKRFGAYVVDTNVGTPFSIYAEIGSDINLHRNGWNTDNANQLQLIRANLRRVTGAKGWIDGNGNAFTPEKNLNLLSMRGNWTLQSGTVAGAYQSWEQAVVFPATTTPSQVVNYNSNNLHPVSWALPTAGVSYKLTARTTGGGKLRLTVVDKGNGNKTLVDTGFLDNGQSATFQWGGVNPLAIVYAQSGIGAGSKVGGQLLRAN